MADGVAFPGITRATLLTIAAAVGLAQLGLATGDAIIALIVFVSVGSSTIAGPVVYCYVGGERAKVKPDSLKDWLGIHNAAVMAVVFVVFGVDLIAVCACSRATWPHG